MLRMVDNARLVIGVAGRIGSGKSEVAQCLRERLGFQYLRYSLILAEWRIMQILPLKHNCRNWDGPVSGGWTARVEPPSDCSD